jgi:hypothetical protein
MAVILRRVALVSTVLFLTGCNCGPGSTLNSGKDGGTPPVTGNDGGSDAGTVVDAGPTQSCTPGATSCSGPKKVNTCLPDGNSWSTDAWCEDPGHDCVQGQGCVKGPFADSCLYPLAACFDEQGTCREEIRDCTDQPPDVVLFLINGGKKLQCQWLVFDNGAHIEALQVLGSNEVIIYRVESASKTICMRVLQWQGLLGGGDYGIYSDLNNGLGLHEVSDRDDDKDGVIEAIDVTCIESGPSFKQQKTPAASLPQIVPPDIRKWIDRLTKEGCGALEPELN